MHKARTSLVCLENTSNRGGGSCYDLTEIKKIRKVCDQHKLMLHLDGARLFNALVAGGENPQTFGNLFNSISVCFNKGLGCPAGSVLLGTTAFIGKARRIRKLFGGGMRQSGFMAATALYALEHHVDRLAEDHAHAKQIADTLRTRSFIKDIFPVETNLIIFELVPGSDPKAFSDSLKESGIWLLPISSTRLRMVTHLDISPQMVEKVCQSIRNL